MTGSRHVESDGASKGLPSFLIATAVISGALVMVIEVLGSRVIGPFFGVSLFVWTSLISVTMIALAAGYILGGLAADRRGTPDYLYGVILASGVAVLLIPLLKGPVLKLCFPLGLRLGTFGSAAALFGPSLLLLGCVAPYIVKIAAREMEKLGRVVGGFYALSTLGSVLGTVTTGFVLIAYLGVDRIFALVGALLILLSVVYFVLLRRKWAALLALALPMALSPRFDGAGVSKVMENGTRVTSVAARDSFYGSVKVVDYSYKAIHTRELIIDGLIQGGIDMRNGLSIYGYSYILQFLPYAINPEGRACLVIGLGAGIIPRWYERQGIRTDVVDIDPMVVEFAKEYFDFSNSGEIVIDDARYYLSRTARTYDFVILDVFSGDTTPGYLLSQEAIALLKERMSERAVLGINLVGGLRRENLMTASVVGTLRTVFDQVEIYPTFAMDSGETSGNLALIAYSGSPRPFDLERVRRFPVHPRVRASMRGKLYERFELPEGTPAIILTDDYNPLDFYDAGIREGVRREILETTDWDVLIETG
jgi:spermidine synthase